MDGILAKALHHKYKNDAVRRSWCIKGPNWWDVEILEDDGAGKAQRASTQFTQAELETAVEEWIEAVEADPSLDVPTYEEAD